MQQPHEYLSNGTVKILTLFHPADVQVILKGVESVINKVLYSWLKEQLSQILDVLPPPKATVCDEDNRELWEIWRQGLKVKLTLLKELPPLCLLLICDNLNSHKTSALVICFCDHGILPLYIPLSSGWLNMAESSQKILKQRVLDGVPASRNKLLIVLKPLLKFGISIQHP